MPTQHSAGDATDAALDAGPSVHVEHEDAVVEADLEQTGPVGVRLRRLKVSPTAAPRSLGERARSIAERVRPGGERLDVVEVDDRLGGGTLRTAPGDLRGGRYFEVDVEPQGGAEVRRVRVDQATGQRHTDTFDLTRDQLRQLVDGLSEAGIDTDAPSS